MATTRVKNKALAIYMEELQGTSHFGDNNEQGLWDDSYYRPESAATRLAKTYSAIRSEGNSFYVTEEMYANAIVWRA